MKEMNRKSFLKGALSLGAAGALGSLGFPVLAQEGAEPIYTPGTYTAKAMGFHADVLVEVTFDETHITAVKVDTSGETESVGGAAAEILEQQILQAQSPAIDGVAGATVTTGAVRRCVGECISKASGGKIVPGGPTGPQEELPPMGGGSVDWLGEAPEIDESEITETLQTEVLVIGAGNAGLMAAARAAMEGASVLVLEKAISCMTERHWIGAVDTRAQKEHGTEIDKDKLVAELARYANNRCDQKLIRLWADHSGEAMDWFEGVVQGYYPDVVLNHEWDVGEEGAYENYYIPPTMHNFQDNILEHDYTQETSTYGLLSLAQAVTDHGGQILYSTALVKLEQDEEGKVCGAIAKNEEGSYIRIEASKGVALCCGGYPGDKAMFASINPQAYAVISSSIAASNDSGDGIRAAMWIGAQKDDTPTAMLFDRGLLFPGALPDGSWQSGPFHLGSQPWLKVNNKGERFTNESVPYDAIIHAGYMEPGHVYNTIYDSAWMDHVAQFHQFGCARIIPSPTGGKLQAFNPGSEAGVLGAMVGAGFIQQADTLEELAEKLKLPVETFVATVNRYNELCEKGVDEDFGKPAYRMIPLNHPPYFGARQGAQLLCTLDGLRINTQMQVLGQDGEPIPGLYAAGDCSGGFFANTYPEYIVGVAVGRTLTQGYLLGKIMAS